MPSKFEAGSPNVPGIVGLGAGIEFLTEHGLTELEQTASDLTARLLEGFQSIAGYDQEDR